MSNELGILLQEISSIPGATHLEIARYRGYHIKKLNTSDLSHIKSGSHQTHIAITNPQRGMLLFPFVTSSLYESELSKGKQDPGDEKNRYRMRIAFRVPTKSIVRCRENASGSWGKYKRDQNKSDFEATTQLLAKDPSDWISGHVSAVIQIRGTGQRQLELGRIDDGKEWQIIKGSLSPDDRLIFLQREDLAYDLFLVHVADLTKGFQNLPDFWMSDQRLTLPIGFLMDNPTDSRSVSRLVLPKPFILLAGISGTGKSRFVGDQAQSVQSAGSASNCCLIPVRPDWHEPADLLGYTSRIGGEKYISTEFLKFLVTAWVDATDSEGRPRRPDEMTPHWICLDEMNLAPVEQYFSDFLSVLETRRIESGVYRCNPLLRASELRALEPATKIALKNDLFAGSVDALKRDKLFDNFVNDPVWGGIPIPPNLIVAGTVNMDETAHGFSRKVIDRALTLDFQEFYPNEFDLYLKGRLTGIRTLSFPFAYDAREESVRSALNLTADGEGDRTVQFIGDLNTVLKDTPFELAYRALNEAILSVACFAHPTTPVKDSAGERAGEESSAGNAELPKAVVSDEGYSSDEFALLATWDDFLMQKVLPRIEGDGAKLKALRQINGADVKLPPDFGRGTILHQLYALLAQKLKPIWGNETDDIYEPTKAAPTRPDLLRQLDGSNVIPCRSRKKLRWMMQRLKANHFTDFWC